MIEWLLRPWGAVRLGGGDWVEITNALIVAMVALVVLTIWGIFESGRRWHD